MKSSFCCHWLYRANVFIFLFSRGYLTTITTDPERGQNNRWFKQTQMVYQEVRTDPKYINIWILFYLHNKYCSIFTLTYFLTYSDGLFPHRYIYVISVLILDRNESLKPPVKRNEKLYIVHVHVIYKNKLKELIQFLLFYGIFVNEYVF